MPRVEFDETFAAFGLAQEVPPPAPDDLEAIFGAAQGKAGAKKAKPFTFKDMALAIEDRHPRLEVRFMCSANDQRYPKGCWAIEQWSSAQGQGGYKRLRYCDNEQLAEMYQALNDSDRFWRLARGEGVERGPYRGEGLPQIPPQGMDVTSEEARTGGQIEVCQYIEQMQEGTAVKYAGRDESWPTGCWIVETVFGRELLDKDKLLHLAHEVLGLPRLPNQINGKRYPPKSIALLARQTVCEQCFSTFSTTHKEGPDICPACHGGPTYKSTYELAQAQTDEVEAVFGGNGQAQSDDLEAIFGAAPAQVDEVDEVFGLDPIPF